MYQHTITIGNFGETLNVLHNEFGISFKKLGDELGYTDKYIMMVYYKKRPITKQLIRSANDSLLFRFASDYKLYELVQNMDFQNK